MLLETFKIRKLRHVLTLIGLLGVLLVGFPRGAFADSGSLPTFGIFWYGPNDSTVSGVKYWQTGVTAYTDWDAALYALGYSTDTINGLSNAKKYKLMDSETGGDYYTLAKSFKVGEVDNNGSVVVPGAGTVGLNTSSMWSSWVAARAMYGETYCYHSTYSDDLKQGARDDADKIIKGGEHVGPETGEHDEGYFVLDKVGNPSGNFTDYQSATIQFDSSGVCTVKNMSDGVSTGYGEQVRVCIPKNLSNNWNSFASTNGFDTQLVCYRVKYGSATISGPVLVGYNSELVEVKEINGGLRFQTKSGTTNSSLYVGYMQCKSNVWVKGTSYSYSANFNSNRYTFGSRYYQDWEIWYSDYYDGSGAGGGESGGGESGGGEDEDPDPDPDPPTWPKAPSKPVGGGPDVPTPPTDPTIPLPPEDPTPTPPTPWDPIPDIDIDITGEDFQDLIDALNEHCIHLQTAIQSNISQLWDLQSSFYETEFSDLFGVIRDNLQWLGNDVIVTCFTDLKDYLHSLFDWLAERMDFNISVEGGQYDDTSVIYWLKQIWAAIGSGINTEPVDPVTKSDDWWAWLLALMGNFVAMLLAFGSDRLGDVTNAVQTLAGKFPFCLPWDLAAMFALLDATPVIPSFDLPCYALTSNGLSEVGQYHITLEAFDGVWEGIRWVERLGFVVMLIRYTDKLMAVMRRAVGR